jgi:hypothetical protein
VVEGIGELEGVVDGVSELEGVVDGVGELYDEDREVGDGERCFVHMCRASQPVEVKDLEHPTWVQGMRTRAEASEEVEEVEEEAG